MPPSCLDIACAHFASDVIGLPDRQRYNSQRRIFGSARGKLRPIRDEQVFDIMSLTPFVHHAVLWLFRHAVGAQIVGRWIRWRWEGPCGSNRIIDSLARHCQIKLLEIGRATL